MYLVPFYFVDKKEIKFPKNYKKKFNKFNNPNDVLLAYAETMMLAQEFLKLDKRIKLKDKQSKKVKEIIKKLQNKCFITPHQSILFYSQEMNDQFNYIYYLILDSYKKLNK